MPIFSKPKPVSKTSPKPLSLAFTNIRGLSTNCFNVESFLTHRSPGILALCETNLNLSISSVDFVVYWYLPINRKDSSSHMHGIGP